MTAFRATQAGASPDGPGGYQKKVVITLQPRADKNNGKRTFEGKRLKTTDISAPPVQPGKRTGYTDPTPETVQPGGPRGRRTYDIPDAAAGALPAGPSQQACQGGRRVTIGTQKRASSAMADALTYEECAEEPVAEEPVVTANNQETANFTLDETPAFGNDLTLADARKIAPDNDKIRYEFKGGVPPPTGSPKAPYDTASETGSCTSSRSAASSLRRPMPPATAAPYWTEDLRETRFVGRVEEGSAALGSRGGGRRRCTPQSTTSPLC